MENTKALAEKLLAHVMGGEDMDITSTDDVTEEEALPLENGRIGRSYSFVMNADGDTPSGVPCRKRWQVTVTCIEDSRADD